MSRRRKHGDSPGLKNTPRKAAAAEECSSMVEPGKRRLRSARGSEPRRAGETSPRPVPQQEQPPAAASCSKSNPEERYETPKRVLKMDLLSSTFSSPNDPDGQNDIFWDQNSPMTKQLGKGRKKQIYTTDSDEISHIVNRIAPQDEKPTTNSMLGMWIGATAIPCTPSVAKGKSRAKISCTKLKTQNREEELMKLAKQFDKNMEELDVIQEQNKRNHDFIQTIAEAETLTNYKDNVQMQLLHDIGPEIDNSIIKKPMKENTKMSVVNDQNSSQKPFDQNAEAAFNAIFDGSTQKCSGHFSQDLSDAFLNTSNTNFEKKSALKEEKIIMNEILVPEKLPDKTPGSLFCQVDTPGMTKSCVTSYTEKPEAFHKHLDAFTTSDFEDDWENLLSNEPFVMQNVKMCELFPAPRTAQIADQKQNYNFNNKNDKNKSRMNTSLDTRVRDSKILQDLPSKTYNKELIDSGKYGFSLNPNDKPSKLPSTGNKMKFEKSFNKTVVQDKIQDCAVASNLTKVKEDMHTKFTSNVNISEKSTLNTGYSNEQKNKSIYNQSFKAPANIDHFGSATLGNETSVYNPNQTNTSKLGSFFDDWNDPSFANEVVKACHQLENTWEADDVDDDLLYQACDDIERLTQQQDIRKDSKISESKLEINNSSKHGTENMFTTSKESQLVQSKHLNLSSISGHTSFTNSPQLNKPVKMEKGEICGNSPSFLGATTNLTIYSKNSNCQINNLRYSWNNTDVPIQVNSTESVLIGNSSLNVSSDHRNTETATYKKKLSTQHLSHRSTTDGAKSDLNRPVRFPKYTFTKMKNSQILSQFNQNCIPASISDTKITQGLEKNKTVSPFCGKTVQQQSLVKHSESMEQPSKEEEEKNKKYSPEEIQRKRQEALVRRMAKAQASSVKAAPI
ncbi:ewing's tumor-associated antigen 1 isoform X1 [Leptonychotes weddellii]|uniref:Ewing's tumor-associated antigen 1 isoform X1 n=2 Tax=Leptonychotes weddellii TaxID=9713 RepID=A0A7F8QGG5_LEPWE|nr:ewing's tumor-associated antigen 1 isoform X1 [Leptonychotes weddellii]